MLIMIRNYRHSALALAMNIIGMFMVAVGIPSAFSGEIILGIVFTLLGVGLEMGAIWVANAKRKKDMLSLENHEFDERFINDVRFCEKFFRNYPTRQIAEYIISLNPESSERIYRVYYNNINGRR